MLGHYTTGPREVTVAEHTRVQMDLQKVDPDLSSPTSRSATRA